MGAATDYTQYATVYGITDISLSGSDVIQIRSQLRDPHTVEFGWSFFVDKPSLKRIIFHAQNLFNSTIFRPQNPQI